MGDFYAHLSQAFALRGGELPPPPPPEETEAPAQKSSLEKEALARALFTGFELPAFAQQLSRLHDGLPLPSIFAWDLLADEEIHLQELNAQELRTYRAFRQILDKGRKSGKYLQAMRELLVTYPDKQELGLLISQYLRVWHPDEHSAFVESQLQQNPHWRILKYLYAGYLLLEISQPEIDPAALKQQFLSLMENKLELHQHLPSDTLPLAWEVLAFYQTQAAWYLLGDFQLERALYAVNVCFQVSQELYPEDQEQANEAEGLLQAWFTRMNETPDATARVRVFLRPLIQARLEQIRARQTSETSD
ncbi:hypothetical protein COW36_18310 [bacterium (Candidatus Blackallbacteria) CG17_big_fil_post_rev_8_21_14_2_50_48_46]|uniref:Uncharacterized protein n=1 Tax=bacterium (Candidatus Blackallbacteria) CG17_big_fil_post_rev_8_21_14_2_50_48_46 TaxID=2014261 RepID=A0A2M7G207_9BACT|nr:MAG: hypothetical protein COW64_00425 [bacterium (Candidatus Blackallbacteria) CG18_big_fil_WC_8_21_14_2_50_49_26]PIW15370.1 MAG: hypothetical protein COW36_18310 [bacterium (Candidatus Blackallbacteria) CG17_big_fil_post_rev_8_21_14_2_50_48_46]PIW49769.1 MAG: hypothetical protein COW20_05055 [bacterium (Candidatus Blackallbacteria) CG13_big_fil_rev_8_21_14_2_50_49_14]